MQLQLGAAPDHALLVIHPAERKSRRIRPQPDRPGEVIQDPDDGELSGSVVWRGKDGTTRETELATMSTSDCDSDYAIVECDTEGSAVPGTEPSDTTLLTYLRVYYEDGWGANELEFTTKYYDAGIVVSQYEIRIEGVEFDSDYHPNQPLIYRRIREGGADKLNVRVIEKDQFFDDEGGNRDFWSFDRNVKRDIIFGPRRTTVRLSWTPKIEAS